MLTGEKGCRFVCRSKGVRDVEMPQILDGTGGSQDTGDWELECFGWRWNYLLWVGLKHG